MSGLRNDAMLTRLPAPGAPRRNRTGAARDYGPHNMQYWYVQIADYMIARPGIKLAELAKLLDKSPSWLSVVCSSDFFHRYLMERRAKHEQELDTSIRSSLLRLAGATTDLLLERVEAKAVTTQQGIDIASKTLAALGYGSGASPASVHVNVNATANAQAAVVPVAADVLHEARNRIRAREQAQLAAPIIELEGGVGGPSPSSAAEPIEVVAE